MVLEKVKDFLFPDKRKDVLMHIDEDRIKNDEIIKAQARKLASYESYFGRLEADKREKKHEEEQEILNQQLIEKANEEAKDIKAGSYGKVTSLGKFYYRAITGKNCPTAKLYDSLSDWGSKIDLTDKEGVGKIGKWGDIVLIEGGKLAVIDSDNNIVSNGRTLPEIIYKPDSFETFAGKSLIRIPVDKDGQWIQDLDYVEIEEPLRVEGKFDEGTGRIVWSKVKKSEVKKIVARQQEEVQELTNQLEFQETVNLKQNKEISELKRINLLLENKSYSAESTLSSVMKVHNDMEARWGDMQNRLTNATELNLMWQNVITKKDEIINKVLTKLEEATNTTYQRVKQEIMSDLQAYKGILPSQNTEIIKPEKEEESSIQPGQPIKK